MNQVPQYPSPSFRLLAVMALFVGLGAGGWVFFSFILPSLTDDGKTVYIKADKTPVKTAPDQPGGMEIPHQDKLVFNAVSGSGAAPATPERIAPPPEEPIYGNAPATPVPTQSAEGTPPAETLVGAQPPAGQTDAPSAAGSAPKAAPLPVALGRAVQPGPDGTEAGQGIKAAEPVSSFNLAKADPTVTPVKAAPSPKPAKQVVVKVQVQPVAPKQQAAPIAAQGNIQEQEVTAQSIAVQSDVGATVVHQEAGQAPQVREPTVTTVKIEAPASAEQAHVVAVRTEAPLLSVEPLPAPSNASAPEPITPAAPSSAMRSAPVVEGWAATGARYQLASYTDRGSAEKAVGDLAGKYGSVVSSPLRVVQGTVRGHEVFRVQGVASSKTAAQAVCGRVKAQGGACVLARP